MSVVGERSTEIDGITYVTKTLPAREACYLWPRLVKIVGRNTMAIILTTLFPALFPAEAAEVKGEEAPAEKPEGEPAPAAEAPAEEEPEQLLMGTAAARLFALASNPAVLSAIVVELAERMVDSPDGLEEIAPRLCKHMRCDKIRVGNAFVKGDVFKHFDSHFAGRFYHLLHVCVWVIGINFIVPSDGGP